MRRWMIGGAAVVVASERAVEEHGEPRRLATLDRLADHPVEHRDRGG